MQTACNRDAQPINSPRDEGDADHDISWQKAVKTAERWLASQALARGDLTGKTVDLREAAGSLPFDTEFKRMVIEAARRNLKKRNALEIILPE
jgi:proline dehydrogenase